MAEPAQTVFLFVGGPRDGEVAAVELVDGFPPDRQMAFVQDPVRYCVNADVTPPIPVTNFRSYDYRLTALPGRAAGRRRLWFYAGEDVPDPFARLLAGYKPEKADA